MALSVSNILFHRSQFAGCLSGTHRLASSCSALLKYKCRSPDNLLCLEVPSKIGEIQGFLAYSYKLGAEFPVVFRALSRSGDEAANLNAQQKQQISGNRAIFMAKRKESIEIEELERPLSEYMSLPASQYSVLDAERIERVDDNTFLCYIYRLKFFSFEVCPVLLVRVEEKDDGCCINLLSCKLEGSPPVVAQNEKFSASMVNEVSYRCSMSSASMRQLMSETKIEVVLDIPFPFLAMPVQLIESTGNKVLEQLLGIMLPRFLQQLAKDYKAWASGDGSRRPLGTGQI